MHSHQVAEAEAGQLLSLADADRLITSSGLRTPTMRLVEEGRILPERDYLRSATLAGRPVTGLIDSRKVLAYFAAGATVVFQGLQRYWPALMQLAEALEVELGHPIQVNAYLTPAGSQGFAAHADTHDVFVLQTHGSKTWYLHHDDISEPETRVLSPGTCLYLPTGTRHSARAQEGVSLHITVGINQLTSHHLLRRAFEQVLASVPNQHLPAGLLDRQPEAAELLAAGLKLAAEQLQSSDPHQLVQALVQQRLRNGVSRLPGGLLDLAEIDTIEDQTVLRRRLHHPFVWSQTVPERLTISLGDRTLDVPDWLGPALQQLKGLETFTPADLDLDQPSRVVLCRRLIREGLLTVARDENDLP